MKREYVTRIKPAQLNAEKLRRNQSYWSLKQEDQHGKKMQVDASSVAVQPLPLDKIAKYEEVLQDLEVSHLVNSTRQQQPLYTVVCQIISQGILKDLIRKGAKISVKKMESNKVDRRS